MYLSDRERQGDNQALGGLWLLGSERGGLEQADAGNGEPRKRDGNPGINTYLPLVANSAQLVAKFVKETNNLMPVLGQKTKDVLKIRI
jgi:hypothetical protein